MKIFSAILIILGACASSASANEANKGYKIAKIHCSRCHVVDEKNKFSGISSTPSFSILVNYLKDWEERFLSFHTRLPHPSIIQFRGEKNDPEKPVLHAPVVLEYNDIRAITEYARTLHKQ